MQHLKWVHFSLLLWLNKLVSNFVLRQENLYGNGTYSWNSGQTTKVAVSPIKQAYLFVFLKQPKQKLVEKRYLSSND
jgi:hypothetical protein